MVGADDSLSESLHSPPLLHESLLPCSASIAQRAHSLKHFGLLCYAVATTLTLLLEPNTDLLVQVSE